MVPAGALRGGAERDADTLSIYCDLCDILCRSGGQASRCQKFAAMCQRM